MWYAVFALPLFLFVPKIGTAQLPLKQAVCAGIKDLLKTLHNLPQEKNILIYLIAHLVYTDGLNTLFAFGGIYAAGTYGFTITNVLIFGISMNVTAGIGAISLGWLDDYIGSKPTIIISLIFLIILGLTLLLIKQKTIFWLISLLLAIFVGPVQAASRSLMVRLFASNAIPAEMFGLYALSGRVTAFVGPWLFGISTLWFDTQRAGMAAVIVFFIVGTLLLLPVKVTKH